MVSEKRTPENNERHLFYPLTRLSSLDLPAKCIHAEEPFNSVGVVATRTREGLRRAVVQNRCDKIMASGYVAMLPQGLFYVLLVDDGSE